MAALPEELHCAGCRRSGPASEAAAGWSLSRPPRPTGPARRQGVVGELTAHCPDCARRHVRDLEARLDP